MIVGLLVGLGMLLLSALLVVQRAHDTVLDASFYTTHLERAGVFDALAGDFVPDAVGSSLRARFPQIDQAAVDDASSIANRTLSPGWFAAAARDIAKIVIPWLIGEEETFDVTLPVADRVRHAGALVRARIQESPAVHSLYDQVLMEVAKRIVEDQPTMPFGITIEPATWQRALETAAPYPWVAGNLSRKVGHAADYLVGDTDDLSIMIPLYEQQDETATAIRIVVEETDTLAFVRHRIIEPAIHENVEDKEVLSSVGIVLDKEEIANAFVDVLTTEWVKRVEGDIVRVVANYVSGRTNELTLVVNLRPIKVLAADRLTGRVDTLFEFYYQSLPECTREQLARKLVGLDMDVYCRPASLTYDETKDLLGIDVHAIVVRKLDERIPNRWVHDEARIRTFVSPETWAAIDRTRHYMQHGFVIDEVQLREFMADAEEDTLARTLKVTRGGVEFTDRQAMLILESRSGMRAVDRVVEVRRLMSRLRQSRLPLVLGLLLVALALTVLTRRRPAASWRALCIVLLGCSTLTFCVSSVLHALITHDLSAIGDSLSFYEGSSAASVVAQAAPSVISSMADEYFSGLARYALATGVLGLFGAIVWMTIASEASQETPDEPTPRHSLID